MEAYIGLYSCRRVPVVMYNYLAGDHLTLLYLLLAVRAML